jgi:hypothetical protein
MRVYLRKQRVKAELASMTLPTILAEASPEDSLGQ